MTNPIQLPSLPSAPEQYEPEYFNHLLNQLLLYFNEQNSSGPIIFSRGKVTAMPSDTQANLLPPGTLYESNGVVKIVRAKDIFFIAPAAMQGRIGTITTTP